MDAVKYLEELKRMCSSFGNNCKGCGMDELRNELEGCSSIIKRCPEESVAIVEKWSAEHPVKTRQSEFLKMFPNASLATDEVIAICPKDLDKEYKCCEQCRDTSCSECRKEYWLAEVE